MVDRIFANDAAITPTGATKLYGDNGTAEGPVLVSALLGLVPSSGAASSPTLRTITTGNVTVVAADAGGYIEIKKATKAVTSVALLAGTIVTILDDDGDGTTQTTLVPPTGYTVMGQPTFVIDRAAYGPLSALTVVLGAGSNFRLA